MRTSRIASGLITAGVALACSPLGGCLRWGYLERAPHDGGATLPDPADPPSDAGAGRPDAAVTDGMDGGSIRPPSDAGSGQSSRDADATASLADAAVIADAAVMPLNDAGGASTALEAGAPDQVEAAGVIEIGTLGFNGSGCSAADATADLSDRPMRFHLNFMLFTMSAGASATAMRSCSFGLQLGVPAGVALRMVGGSFHGDYTRPTDGSVSVISSYSFDSDSSTPITRMLPVATGVSLDTDDDVRDVSNASAGWTACSAQHSDLMARASLELSGADGATCSIRSGDLFRIESRYCTP